MPIIPTTPVVSCGGQRGLPQRPSGIDQSRGSGGSKNSWQRSQQGKAHEPGLWEDGVEGAHESSFSDAWWDTGAGQGTVSFEEPVYTRGDGSRFSMAGQGTDYSRGVGGWPQEDHTMEREDWQGLEAARGIILESGKA